MAQTTGPILVAGSLTWANQVLLEQNSDIFDNTVRIGVATGMLTGVMYGLEKISAPIATGLSWAILATVLLVRTKNNVPTPLERAFTLIGVNK